MTIYECSLSIPVWNKNTDRKSPSDYAPTLTFSGGVQNMPLATVKLALSERRARGPSRWMVWCPDRSGVNHLDYDNGLKRSLYGRGEAQPRDTAKDGIQHALNRIEDQIPVEDYKSLVKAAEILLPILEITTKYFEKEFSQN